MNAFRRFLLRRGMASRMFVMAAFAVLLVRALLPGAVMLDPVSATDGGFALVMCSGHGPMFARDPGAMADMSDTMAGVEVNHMLTMTHDGMDMADMPGMSGSTPAHDTMAQDDGLCAFSAALVVACVGIALAVVLFTLTRITQTWRAVAARPLLRPSLYFRPLSRAPPLFS